MDSIKAIIGLGNPGSRYDSTRHNIGLDLLSHFASTYPRSWQTDRDGVAVLEVEISGKSVMLIKLNSYMNHSGHPVSKLRRKFQLAANEILILYDDMDLPLGTIRIRPGGGAGGHKGMESIIDLLETDQFPRLRIGIGKAKLEGEEIRHVLGKFTVTETKVLEAVRTAVSEAIPEILQNGLDKAMGKFNVRAEIKINDLDNT